MKDLKLIEVFQKDLMKKIIKKNAYFLFQNLQDQDNFLGYFLFVKKNNYINNLNL